MPNSSARSSSRAEGNLKVNIELRSRITALEAANLLLKKNNGLLLGDEGDDFSENENYFIKFKEIESNFNQFKAKYEAMEKAKNEAHSAVRNIKSRVVARIGKKGLKTFLSHNANPTSLEKIDKFLVTPATDEPALTNSDLECVLKCDHCNGVVNSNGSGNKNDAADSDNFPKKLKPSDSMELPPNNGNLIECLERLSVEYENEKPNHGLIVAELMNVIRNLNYGLALCNEANDGVSAVMNEILAATAIGKRKIERNLHICSTEQVFCAINEAVDSLEVPFEKMKLSKKAVNKTYSLKSDHPLLWLDDYARHRKDFFRVTRSVKGKPLIFLQSSTIIEKNIISYISTGDMNKNDKVNMNRPRSATGFANDVKSRLEHFGVDTDGMQDRLVDDLNKNDKSDMKNKSKKSSK